MKRRISPNPALTQPRRKAATPNAPLATPCHTRRGFTLLSPNRRLVAAASRMPQAVPPQGPPAVCQTWANSPVNGNRRRSDLDRAEQIRITPMQVNQQVRARSLVRVRGGGAYGRQDGFGARN